MNIKNYLSQALWLDQKIDAKLEQLEILRALATKVTANLTEEKVSGGKSTKSHTENVIAKIVDLEKEINADIAKLVDTKAEIVETINLVEDPMCQLLLEMRYVSGKTWDEIAQSLSCSARSVFNIHGRALREVGEIKKLQ